MLSSIKNCYFAAKTVKLTKIFASEYGFIFIP